MFIGGEHILSHEGTTHGDPLAMAMYALGTLPLILKLQEDIAQAWYADDAMARGELTGLRTWWDKLGATGPQYGYHPNPSKTWLVVKPEHLPAAEEQCQDTGVRSQPKDRDILGLLLVPGTLWRTLVGRKSHFGYPRLRNYQGLSNSTPGSTCSLYTRTDAQVDFPNAHSPW